jgi:hypothetical protein
MTFAQNVLNQSDACGTISWTFACALADLHCLGADFQLEYAAHAAVGDRVDAGEFLVWMGY